MTKVLIFLLRLFILGTILVVAAISLPDLDSSKLIAASSLAALLLVLGLMLGFKGGGILGFLIVFAPMLGRGSFYLAWSGFLIGQAVGDLFESDSPHEKRIDDNASRDLLVLSALCFLVIFIMGFFIPIRLDFDLWTSLDVLKQGGLLGFRQYWSGVSSSTGRALVTLSGYTLIFLHITAQVSSRDVGQEIRQLLRGLSLGLVASLLVLVAQSQGVSGFLVGNFSEYWRTLKQYPAAATDPNALAIMAALLFPMVATLFESTRSRALVLFAFFTLGLYSGSRTFLLSIFLSSAAVFYVWIRKFERKELTRLFIAGLFGVFSAVVMLGQPQVNQQIQKILPFPASVRVLKSINWHERSSMFSSRVIFSKVAVETWRKSPIIGVGLERFFDNEKAIMEDLGIDIDGFTDNANNFYLQVLSENGILGFSLLLFSISILFYIVSSPSMEDNQGTAAPLELRGTQSLKSLPRAMDYPPIELQTRARLTLGVFLFVLVSGAHLLSPEVQLIFALLLVAAFCRPALIRKVMLRQIHLAVVACLFIFALGTLVIGAQTYPSFKTKGFYPPDGASLPLTRWSGSKGRISICNNTDDTIKFRIRSLKPGSDKRPQKVLIHEGDVDLGDTTQRFELTNTEWTEVIVNLRPDAAGRFTSAVVNLKVDSIWSPTNLNIGSDPRWLGVLVELPKGTC